MTHAPDILCIGSVLWDLIGRAPGRMALGHDRPGTIRRLPGGVAMNVAMACLRAGMRPGLLTLLGRDAEGRALADACAAMGMVTDHITWSDTLPTDRYMAIEAENGLIAAVADAQSLELAGRSILAPLENGGLASAGAPWRGIVVLDGNLADDVLAEIATAPALALCDLRVVPASPGKARRMLHLLGHPGATFYLNRIEAELICEQPFPDAQAAAQALVARGVRRVLVTDGAGPVCEARGNVLHHARPPHVPLCRLTGAGDTFMAGHIAAEQNGLRDRAALEAALRVTAEYISAPEA